MQVDSSVLLFMIIALVALRGLYGKFHCYPPFHNHLSVTSALLLVLFYRSHLSHFEGCMGSFIAIRLFTTTSV